MPFADFVVAGSTVYISGKNARDAQTGKTISDKTIEGQTWYALEQIDAAMRAAGGSLKGLVKMTTFLKNWNDYRRMRDTERKYFLEHAPELVEEPVASTVVQVTSLPREDFLIEIEAIGIIAD